MNDVKCERNWILEQVNEITLEVARRLPPFEEYSEFVYSVNGYMNAGKSTYAKYLAISACVLRFENKYKNIKDNLWLKTLLEKLSSIPSEDKDILHNVSMNSTPNELENVCNKFSGWMDELVQACKDFIPEKLTPYKHNANNKLPNMDVNFMDDVLLAGSEHTQLGGENFLRALDKAKVKIVIAAAEGNKATDGFAPYWPTDEEEMSVPGLSRDMQLFQIDIPNGGCLNLDWDGLKKLSDILNAYAEFKKFDSSCLNANIHFFRKELDRIFVHCAAGRGRTGSVNALLVVLENVYFSGDESVKNLRKASRKLFINEKISQCEKMSIVQDFVCAINFLRKKRGHAIEWFGQLHFVVLNFTLMSKVIDEREKKNAVLKSEVETLRKLLEMDDNKTFPVTKINKYEIKSKSKYLDLMEELMHVLGYYQHFEKMAPAVLPMLLKLKNISTECLDDEQMKAMLTELLIDVQKMRTTNLPLTSNNFIIMQLRNYCNELNAWSGQALSCLNETLNENTCKAI